MDFAENIDKLSNDFPEKEKFNLSSQIRRAADSIALNISKGSIGQSNPEQRKFIEYAIRSLAEVVIYPFKAKRRQYLSEDDFINFYNESFSLINMMDAFKKNIN